MGTKHKHYDMIVAWANGEEVEMFSCGEWQRLTNPICWSEESTYRIKPKRVKKEGWLNIYKLNHHTTKRVGYIFDTKEAADKDGKNRLDCIRIEWEEE